MSAAKGKLSTVKCIRDMSDFPPECYRLSSDGRKWRKLCDDRRTVSLWLASKANGDGTQIYPGVKSILKAQGWSRAKTFYVLDSLEIIGCVARETADGHKKLTSERGTAKRVFNVEPLRRAHDALEAGKTFIHPDPRPPKVRKAKAGVQNSDAVESNIAQPEVQDSAYLESNIEEPKSKIESWSPVLEDLESNLVLDPTVLLTESNRIQPTIPTEEPAGGTEGAGANPSGQCQKLITTLSEEYARVTANYLNTRAGKDRVITLAAEHGEPTVIQRWTLWLSARNLKGLECPLIKFVEEFGSIQLIADKQAADLQDVKNRREGRTQAALDVQASERKRATWRAGLEATEDIDGYVAANCFPVLYGDRGDGTTVTLASDEAELIQDARRLLTQRREPQSIDALFN